MRGDISAAEARRMVLAAQQVSGPPSSAKGTRPRIRRYLQAARVLQLDAINVLERTQFLVLFSRLGPFDGAALHTMTGPGGDLFEFWGHAASLMPVEDQPLQRWRMADAAAATAAAANRPEALHDPETESYIGAVYAEVAERGPLPASQLSDPRRQDGEWWDRRSGGRRALEHLFGTGRLAAWRSPSFERIYDLPERVIPAAVLAQPTPAREEAHRRLVANAVRALGVATVSDVAEYYKLAIRPAARAVDELVENNDVQPVTVEGWKDTAYIPTGARVPRIHHDGRARLISPFDPLIWHRERAQRLFGLDYRIEVYVPRDKRTHGYFVMPVLYGDRFIGRLDLKADRRRGALLVHAAHAERGADQQGAAALFAELHSLAAWRGLDRVEIAGAGDLAPALQAC